MTKKKLTDNKNISSTEVCDDKLIRKIVENGGL